MSLLVLGLMLIAQSLIPLGQAVGSKGLIDTLTDSTSDIWIAPLPAQGWLIVLFLILLIQGIANASYTLAHQRLGDELSRRVALDIAEHAIKIDAGKLELSTIQDLNDRVRRYGASGIVGVVGGILGIVSNSLQVVTLLSVLIWLEPLMLVALGTALVPYALMQSRLSQHRFQIAKKHSAKQRRLNYYLLLLLDDRFLFEVKAYSLGAYVKDRITTLLTLFNQDNRFVKLREWQSELLFLLIATFIFFFIALRMVNNVLADLLTVGDIVVILGIFGRLRTAAAILIKRIAQTRENLLYVTDFRRLTSIQSHSTSNNSVQLPNILPKATLTLQNVSFAYPQTDSNVLTNITMNIAPGDTVAIVGENGAGKSTLLKLIAKLYEPTQGEIRYGDINLAQTTSDTWLRHISFVMQVFNHYEATVAENIAFGDWEHWGSRLDQIDKIARHANIHEMIQAMPDGYQTTLGRKFGSHQASIGQWQKLAIARAFAKENNTILIFDEPSAHLDAIAENQLFTHLKELAAGRTTLFISHSLANVYLADRIFVLDKGRLIEKGTHEELISLNGQYAKLYKLQSGRFEPS
ncbi:MAG: ABC transporter ATP-binding protein [Candidatus Promineifilaceae bacterium]